MGKDYSTRAGELSAALFLDWVFGHGYIYTMNSEALKKLLAVRPFEPLEVELSSGQVYSIKHPENVMVLKTTLVLTEPENDIVLFISLIHVVAIRKRMRTQAAV